MREYDPIDRVVHLIEAAISALVFAAIMAVLAATIGCASSPARKADLWPLAGPSTRDPGITWWWCAAGELDDGTGVMACGDDYDTCEMERQRALKYGGLASIATVGECDQVQVEP